MIWRRTRMVGACAAAAFALALLGCGAALRAKVGDEPGTLVLARFDRRLVAGTEGRRSSVGAAAAETDASGVCTLRAPASGAVGPVLVSVFASRPGHELAELELGDLDTAWRQPRHQLELPLRPSSGFRGEQLAIWGFDREAHRAQPHLSEDERALVERHITARREHLRARWPDELAAYERARTQRSMAPHMGSFDALSKRSGDPPHLLGMIELTTGGWAIVYETPSGRGLAELSGQGPAVATETLADTGAWSAMTTDPAGQVWLYDAGSLRPLGSGSRSPLALASLTADVQVTAAAWLPGGPVIAVMRQDGAVELRWYTSAGDARVTAQPRGVRAIDRLLAGPEGALFAIAELEPTLEQPPPAHGWQKLGTQTRGLVLLDASGAVSPVLLGVDSARALGDGFVAYAADLYDPLDDAAVQLGLREGLVRQIIFRLSTKGEVLATCDVSDDRVGARPLALAQGTGETITLYETGPSVAPVLDVSAAASRCLEIAHGGPPTERDR